MQAEKNNTKIKLLRAIGSPVLTIWFITAFVLYYLSVSIWSSEAFAKFIWALSHIFVVKLIYVLFFLNICIRIYGFFIKEAKARKERLLLRAPLLLGLVLFLATSFLSVNVRKNKWVLAAEGQSIKVQWESGMFKVVEIKPALKERTLRMEGSGIFDFEPKALILGPDGDFYKIGAFPARKVSKTYIHVLNFGLAPGLELLKEGRTIQKGYLALKLLPFGSVDKFSLQGYEFYIHIVPNKTIKKGDITAREYDIKNPVYNIEILKGDRRILTARIQKKVSFEGFTLRLHPPIFWELLEMVYDPVYPFFLGSLIMILIGVLLYPWSFLFRQRA